MKKRRSHEASVNKEKTTSDHQVDNASHHDHNISKKKKDSKTEKAKEQQEKKPPKKEEAEHKPQKPEKSETKEEKRTKAVEKSLALKEHFEDTPMPQDPRLIARLVVADHIISLHEQIEEPDHKADLPSDELVAALDYMSELAEKLEDPSLEASAEIQAAYDVLLNVTEQALQQAPPEALIEQTVSKHIPEHAVQLPVYGPTTGDLDNPKTDLIEHQKEESSQPPLAAAIISRTTAILHAMASPKNTSQQVLHSGGGHLSHGAVAQAPSIPQASPPRQFTHLSPLEARHEYLRSVAKEHHTTRLVGSSAAPIAALAITSTLRPSSPETILHHNTPTPTAEQSDLVSSPYSPEATSPPPTILPSSTASSERQLSPSSPAARLYEKPPTPQPLNTLHPSSRKLEHLPLQSLLTIASNVSVGYGRYLRKEFEQGHIDREGLVKILKSRAKGKDFAREYRKQSERLHLSKGLSEPLPALPAHNDSPDDSSPDMAQASSHTTPSHKTALQEVSTPSVKTETTSFSIPTPPRTHKGLLKWLIITLTACLLLAILAVFLIL